MVRRLRNFFAYIICAVASVAVTRWIDSTVVGEELIPNLTIIVVALLAINVQTTTVIAVKLRELADKHGNVFDRTVREIRFAIFEQAALVLLSMALSALIKAKAANSFSIPIEVATFFVVYASLHIFLDTAISLLFALFPRSDESE